MNIRLVGKPREIMRQLRILVGVYKTMNYKAGR